ncbi:MAG TPA: adenine phosphoribosyltransferase [Candidatus Dormibacteraeota bacterium]|nr:adenine phosphoribosyltransferase [Candidatus Dormibacteraeota bacterium]
MPDQAADATDHLDALTERLRAIIRDVPDFPRAGILFKDITTLLQDAGAYHEAIDRLAGAWSDARVDVVAGVESRGFVIGGALAYLLGAGFVPVRKAGRLPSEKIALSYSLEYGEAELEIHTDAVAPGQRVLVVDDLLATGGTVTAAIELVRRLGGDVVGVAFLVELAFLGGAERLGPVPRVSLVTF